MFDCLRTIKVGSYVVSSAREKHTNLLDNNIYKVLAINGMNATVKCVHCVGEIVENGGIYGTILHQLELVNKSDSNIELELMLYNL